MEATAKNRNMFDKFVLVLGLVESLTTLPQLYQVWIKGQTEGVAVITWTSYCLIECVWLVYGIRQKDKAIIGSSISWGLMEALVTVGVLVK